MLGAASAVSGVVGGLASIGTGIANSILQHKQFNYQKELNERMMQREDTAVQRRAADLEKAGLSKTLAAGGAAQASPMSAGEAPQIDPGVAQGIDQMGRSWQQYEQNYIQQKQFAQQERIQNVDALTREFNLMQGMLSNLPVGERPNFETWMVRQMTKMQSNFEQNLTNLKTPGQYFDDFMKKVKKKWHEYNRPYHANSNGAKARRALERWDESRSSGGF